MPSDLSFCVVGGTLCTLQDTVSCGSNGGYYGYSQYPTHDSTVVHGKCCFHSSGGISVPERVSSFVLSQKTEVDGAPQSCFLCQSLGLFHLGIGSKLD